MKLTRIACALVAILLVAPAVLAAEDLTGKWSGSFTVSVNGAEQGQEAAYMDLKHAGKQLTGTAGPSADQQWPIQKGTIVVSGTAPKESTKALFEVQSEGGNGPLLHFELDLVEGHLKGNAKAEQNGVSMTAVLDLTRVK